MTSSSAPVGALTAPPPARSLVKGLVWPPEPETLAYRKKPRNMHAVAWVLAMTLAGLAGAALQQMGIALIGIGLSTFGLVVAMRSALRGANKRLGVATEHIADREIAKAERAFDAIARDPAGLAQVRSIALVQLASVYGLRGETEKSLRLHCAAQKLGGLPPQVAESVPFHIARCYALLGETGPAEGWFAHADAKRNFMQAHAGDVVLAIIRARQGRFDDAVAALEARWQRLEVSMTGDGMKAVRLLLAYCLERRARADDAKRIEQLVAGARPLGFEVRAIAVPWPEMFDFVRRRIPDEQLPEPS